MAGARTERGRSGDARRTAENEMQTEGDKTSFFLSLSIPRFLAQQASREFKANATIVAGTDLTCFRIKYTTQRYSRQWDVCSRVSIEFFLLAGKLSPLRAGKGNDFVPKA